MGQIPGDKKAVITKIQITSEVLFRSSHGISKLKFGGLLEQRLYLVDLKRKKDRFVMSAVIQVYAMTYFLSPGVQQCTTREKRGKGVRRKVAGQTKVTGNWSDFVHDPTREDCRPRFPIREDCIHYLPRRKAGLCNFWSLFSLKWH